jgi:DNA modification methylase
VTAAGSNSHITLNANQERIEMNYQDLLASKRLVVKPVGKAITQTDVHTKLFPFQRDLVTWAVRKGRCALFADTGLGKTFMQLEFARLVGERTLIVAPLSVARQTVAEAKKIDLTVHYTRSQDDVQDGINITNYEMVEHFDPSAFGAVVLDESSILKSLDGKTRRKLTEMFDLTPYRLACTATPAPNDIAEIANHAEFLGIMTRADMLATFFVHDDDGWRLKHHAEIPFYRWMASWGMSIRKPSDLGYSDEGYNLPPLTIIPRFVKSGYVPEGQLFFTGLHGIQDRAEVRKATMTTRCAEAAKLVNNSAEQWIVWHGLNDEGHELLSLIPDAVLVEGADSIEQKLAALEAFQDGQRRVLITKTSIAGFGLNLQNAHMMAFVGLSDSFESYYQAVRRCWRFGQTKPVDAHVILSDVEQEIYHNVKRKEAEAATMSEKLIENVQAFERDEIANPSLGHYEYEKDNKSGDDWTLMLGDSTERLAELADNSIDLSVFSPPFMSLYTYSPTERDLGNSKGPEEFFDHFRFIIDHLLRVTKPGRNCAVHVAQVPAMLSRDGYIGLKDFRGDVIRAFIAQGFIYHGEVCIDKDPQAQAIRTKAKALMFVQMHKDSAWSRPALADYILAFRKPGDNKVPVEPDITNDEWIEWARPVWYGIKEGDTLQFAAARGDDDERHICPLQLGTIERVIRLWSNPGEMVLSPFAGIGSEGYEAVRLGRKFTGIELKREYFDVAVKNLSNIERSNNQVDLFAWAEQNAVYEHKNGKSAGEDAPE